MRRRLPLVLALAAVAAALALATVFFFFWRDNFSTHYPIKVLSARLFRAGELPYWNFHDGGGQPLAGNPNTLTFYPDNILYVLLPPHVAFNFHFLLHLFLGWLAMRALCRARLGESDEHGPLAPHNFAAALYVLSGVAISATAFYNLITAVALIPFALWAAEKRSPVLLGCAFGLLGLAGEPVVLFGAALAVAVVSFPSPGRSGQWPVASGQWRASVVMLLAAIVISIVIVSPLLIAYSEIASEVERAHGYSARTVLNASLHPSRLLDLVAVPGFSSSEEPRLFLTLFVGVIALPALLQRSRYVVIAALMLFLALGRHNPMVRWAIESFDWLRVLRFPEKLALPLVVALVVLVAGYYARTRSRRVWAVITFVPLVMFAITTIPLDRFTYYDAPFVRSVRVYARSSPGGQAPDRDEYRRRARSLEPLFGSVAGVEYAANRSPDGMHSLLSRIVAERVAVAEPEVRARYLRMNAVAGSLPEVFVVPRVIGVRNVNEAVQLIESGAFEVDRAAVAPRLHDFVSARPRALRWKRLAQGYEIEIDAPGPVLLMVNQSYFNAWSAHISDRNLQTVPLDIDRLGVLVPAGSNKVTLRFGRRRTLVLAAWIASSLMLLVGALVLRLRAQVRSASKNSIAAPAR